MQLLLIDRCIALYRTYIRDQDSTKEGKSNLAFVETSLQTSFASVASIGSEGTEAKAWALTPGFHRQLKLFAEREAQADPLTNLRPLVENYST